MATIEDATADRGDKYIPLFSISFFLSSLSLFRPIESSDIGDEGMGSGLGKLGFTGKGFFNF